jgi:hypothetical protein
MLWGQTAKVYTDHKNLTRDAFGLASDRLYHRRLSLEESAPEIVYIKGIHNSVADDISQLDYNPEVNPTIKFNYSTFGVLAKGETTAKWKIFSKFWCCYNKNIPGNETQECNLNKVFANRSKVEEIFSFTTPEIAEEQKTDSKLKHCFKHNAILYKGLDVRLVDNTYILCKDGRMIIPKPLQRRTVLWNHHYLQHPGHTQLEETMKATMYWKDMRSTIWSTTKSCRSCRVNKKQKLKFGHLPSKIIITIPRRALCVDLIGPYILKGKDGTVIDFMALMMIDPTTNWFEVLEVPFICQLKTLTVYGKESSNVKEIFNKTSEHIAWLVNKLWSSRYPRCWYIIYDNGSEFKLNFEYLCITYGIKRKPTTVKNPQGNAILEHLNQFLVQMLRTAKIDTAKTITPNDIGVFLDNAAWAICSTYHTVLSRCGNIWMCHALQHSVRI